MRDRLRQRQTKAIKTWPLTWRELGQSMALAGGQLREETRIREDTHSLPRLFANERAGDRGDIAARSSARSKVNRTVVLTCTRPLPRHIADLIKSIR